MAESRFHTPEVSAFAKALSLAKRTGDLRKAQRLLGSNSYGISAMVSFPEYREGYFALPSYLRKEYLVPYLPHPYMYFICHEPLGRLTLKIDYTVTFDTNAASYISRLVKLESLKDLPNEFLPIIEDMLLNDVNFDPGFYFMENIKEVYPVTLITEKDGINPQNKFWESLSNGFKENIVNLKLFQEVDCVHYRKTGQLNFNITRDEAIRRAINFTYWFYASTDGQELVKHFLLLQKAILYQLISILKVQFSSSREPRNKIKEFLDLVQEKAVYLDRETVIAYMYFKDRSTIPLLERGNKGGDQTNLRDKVENLAWDMTAPRFMEMIIGHGEGDFMLLFLLTFDRNLRELVRTYHVKGVIFDRRSRGVLSIPEINTHDYFVKEGCWDKIAGFFSEEKRRERFSREDLTDESLSATIEKEYKELEDILRKSY